MRTDWDNNIMNFWRNVSAKFSWLKSDYAYIRPEIYACALKSFVRMYQII